MTEDVIKSAWEAGWAVGILVLVLVAIGTGAGLFLKAYLKQQKEEFEARKKEQKEEFEAREKEQERKNSLLKEQHDFIRQLATTTIQERASYIESFTKITLALSEINKSLSSLNTNFSEHLNDTKTAISQLRKGHDVIDAELRGLEKMASKSHIRM